MSHFICSSCDKPHKLFGDASAFDSAMQQMNSRKLVEIPLESENSTLSDAGTPVVVSNPSSVTSKAFLNLAKDVWQQLAK